MELGVEYPSPTVLEDGNTVGKRKDKGKRKAVLAPVSASPSLSTPPPDLSSEKSVASASTSAASVSTLCKGQGSQRSGSSDKSKHSPCPEPANSTPQLLPQPPSTDGMTIHKKQAAYREWHRELADAMGLKEDMRNLFTGKQSEEMVRNPKDDDDYVCDGEGSGEEGSGEVLQRKLRPRKAATNLNNSTIPDNSDPNGADISEPNDDVSKPNDADISMHNNDEDPEPHNTDISDPNNAGITESNLEPDSIDSTLHVDLACKTAHPESRHNGSAPLAAEDKLPVQPITKGDEPTTLTPQDACKPPPPISLSSSDETGARSLTSTTPVGLIDPVVVDGHGDAVMNTDPTLGTSNASLFDAIEVPVINPYPPESLKNSTFIREYATMLLKAPEGEPLPVIWFTLVYHWIELKEKWASIKLEPEAGHTKRPGGRVPPISVQLPSFRNEWWLWYDALNPDWRPREGNVVLPGGDGEWDELECSGKDGFVLLLIGLCWWFDRGGLEDKVGLGHWEHAVKGLYDTTVHLHKW
ncbi:hypothetical protein V5O48_017028, partial [Marasmius crinis-equi]